MNRIQFFPSQDLNSRLENLSNELGITKGALTIELLNSIDDFKKQIQKSKNSSLVVLTEYVLTEIGIYAKTHIGVPFVLNDVPEYRNVPLNLRASIGKSIYLKAKNETLTFKPVIVDGIIKKRQRALLYIHNSKGGEQTYD